MRPHAFRRGALALALLPLAATAQGAIEQIDKFERWFEIDGKKFTLFTHKDGACSRRWSTIRLRKISLANRVAPFVINGR